MFHRPRKSGAPKGLPLKDLTAVLSPVQLLADSKRTELLNQIKTASGLDEKRFESLCLSLIENTATRYQSLPETANSFYAQAGGLIDHALNRTEAALQLFRAFMVCEEGQLSEIQTLWCYALLSAGILQGIGKLQIDLRVDAFDNNGQQIKQWDPLLETLPSIGNYYLHTFLAEGEESFRCRLNLLFAYILMPREGFAWIASNPDVLAIWLALLNEDPYSAGTLGAILIRADAIAIQRYYSAFHARYGGGRGAKIARVSAFVDTQPEAVNIKEQLVGMEFIKWLTSALEAGKIVINKAPLFMVPGGLLMSVEMFRLFMREHPEYKNWQAIKNGFMALNLHGLAADGSEVSRFEQTQTHQMLSGILFSHYAIALPNEVKMCDLKTGKVATISATELIHRAPFNQHFHRQTPHVNPTPLAYLSTTGDWEAPHVETNTGLQKGQFHGG